MPFYEYQCAKCGHHLEAMQKISATPLRKCPECGKPALKRLMSAPVFRLKGAGWYETDFKSDQDNKRNLADKPEADAPKDDKKDDKKEDNKDDKKDDKKEASKDAAADTAKDTVKESASSAAKTSTARTSTAKPGAAKLSRAKPKKSTPRAKSAKPKVKRG